MCHFSPTNNETDQCFSALAAQVAAERQTRQPQWTPTEYSRDSGYQVIEAQASLTPNAIAGECAGRSSTYTELNRQANQLANLFRKRRAQREELIGRRTAWAAAPPIKIAD